MTGQRIRANNGQREQIVGKLNEALIEGRISLTEFEQRATAASLTVWADELATFTADLPERATYEQRAHVIERLGEAAAQGYIKFPEFEERAAAVNQTVWFSDLSPLTTDLPRAFRTAPHSATTSPSVLARFRSRLSGTAVVRKVQRNPVMTAVFVALLVLAVGVGAGVAMGGARPKPIAESTNIERPPSPEFSQPAEPAPAVRATTYSATPAVSSPTSPPTSASAEITIECGVGDSDDKVIYTSLEDVWKENSGTYFCEAKVPDSHRLTSAEKKAVVIDQRIGNGDSIIDSLGVLISFCANTVEYEITDEETRPKTARDFENFDEDRLKAVYTLCPNAPTAKLMREVIYSG